jgi:hypothetical protein
VECQSGVAALFDAFNVIYKEKERRSLLRLYGTTFLFTLGWIAFMLAAIGAVIAARLAGRSHRRIAAVVLDSDMTMRFGAVRLLAFELLLPPPRFSTRRVSASELVAFVDLVWGPGIFISNHLSSSPFGSRGCRDERR